MTFRALERGEKLLGLPALGGLFDRALTPDLDAAQIPNRALLAAAFKLGWLIEDGRRVRINWRDMATEELGSVYEGLLELVPVRENEGRTFSFAGGAEARGNARKVSGSYYTPDSLVQCLLDSALDPVLERAEAEGGAEAILDLNVIDPACGSGHFLLGAARRMATRVAQLRNPDAPDYNAAMRDVVRNCIHGVDRNPMAIELAKVALWIESVEPGKPLGFLDANIQCGDSLLGVFDLKALDEGIPDDAYKPLTGDDKDTAKYFAKRNKDEKKGQGTLDFISGGGTLPPAKLAATMDDLRHLPEDSMAQIAEKRRRFAAWEADPKRYANKVACDLYIAAFLLPKRGGVPTNANSVTVPTTSHLRTRLSGGQIFGLLEAAAVDAAGYARAFHWPLAFPEVMIGKGGFDVVLGNPPWGQIQLDDMKWFASNNVEIACEQNKSDRDEMIQDLEKSDFSLYSRYQMAKRVVESSQIFIQSSGRFPASSYGRLNTAPCFAEMFIDLANQGNAGIIVPSGILTDDFNKKLFGRFVGESRLKSAFDFENRSGLFPQIDSRIQFSLITFAEKSENMKFGFFLTSPKDVFDEKVTFELTPSDISVLSPNTGTAAVFRTRYDADLTTSIYRRLPVLRLEDRMADGNGWDVSTQLMFMINTDAKIIKECSTIPIIEFPEHYLALNEGEYGHQFDHRFATFDRGRVRHTEIFERNPDHEIEFKNCVTAQDFLSRTERRGVSDRRSFVAFRRVARNTDERTMICAALPFQPTSYGWIMVYDKSIQNESLLLANFNSLCFDYTLRNRLIQPSIPQGVVYQCPVIPLRAYANEGCNFVLDRVLELSYTSHSMTPFARDLGYDGLPFAWDEDRRAQLRAELDAWYALAYGLTRDELRYVLDPKDVMGADYPSETFRVLQKNEIAKHGEYRTQRLVLAAYDALVAGGMRPRTEGYR